MRRFLIDRVVNQSRALKIWEDRMNSLRDEFRDKTVGQVKHLLRERGQVLNDDQVRQYLKDLFTKEL